jgi:two-component system chemotaxis response regulator CheB
MTQANKIRVLVVDDSALMRRKLSEIISSDSACEVIATARDGEEALNSVAILRPDVVTLDLELSRMDGMTVLKYIMSEWPTPIIIVTGYREFGGEEVIKCLEYGAVDLVIKPGGPISVGFATRRDELLEKIKAASLVKRSLLRPLLLDKLPVSKKPKEILSDKIIAIASSTGGPKALAEILPRLESDLNAGIIIMQHMPEGFTRCMAERLNAESKMTVREAVDGQTPKKGEILITPGGFHLALEKKDALSAKVKLLKRKLNNELCPSADLAMRSIAPLYGKNCLGVILTGMGSDGVEGLKTIKRCGGSTIAQDEATCIVYGMPRAAIEQRVVDKVLPLPLIPEEIMRWAGG